MVPRSSSSGGRYHSVMTLDVCATRWSCCERARPKSPILRQPLELMSSEAFQLDSRGLEMHSAAALHCSEAAAAQLVFAVHLLLVHVLQPLQQLVLEHHVHASLLASLHLALHVCDNFNKVHDVGVPQALENADFTHAGHWEAVLSVWSACLASLDHLERDRLIGLLVTSLPDHAIGAFTYRP
eukprot:16287-Heterococcus_DN1.PRE.4